MRISVPILARGLAALAAVAAARPARAFLGFGDTSFVTVIANPAEAANWAAELESLNNQLAAARSTLDTVALMRAYAGDPRAAGRVAGGPSRRSPPKSPRFPRAPRPAPTWSGPGRT